LSISHGSRRMYANLNKIIQLFH